VVDVFRYFPREAVYMVLTRKNKNLDTPVAVQKQALIKTSGITQIEGVQELVQLLWERGFMIRGVTWVNSDWIVIADWVDEKKLQNIYFDEDVPRTQINEAIENNKLISFITYCNDMWVILIEQKPRSEPYFQKFLWFRDGTDMVEECEKVWKQGLVVFHLVYGNGAWVMIIGQHPNFYMHWRQEAILLSKEKNQWLQKLMDNTGTKDPKKIKNLYILESCGDHFIAIQWVLDKSMNMEWNIPTIYITQILPSAKWTELGGRTYRDGNFYAEKQ
jgi:hypothetical protein